MMNVDDMTTEELEVMIQKVKRRQEDLERKIPILKKMARRHRRQKLIKEANEHLDRVHEIIDELKKDKE